WRTTPDYGRVWVPVGIGSEWRPYSDGNWVYTDWGWTFASADPWGWACYHYGRWGFGLGIGWYWVPGAVWAPAWVSWRYGGGWVAWAPMGPRGYYWGVRSPAWVAVHEQQFTQPVRAVAMPAQRTASIVAATSPQPVITHPRAGAAFGPPVARVAQAIGQPVRPVPVSRALPNGGLGRAMSYAGSSVGNVPSGRS